MPLIQADSLGETTLIGGPPCSLLYLPLVYANTRIQITLCTIFLLDIKPNGLEQAVGQQGEYRPMETSACLQPLLQYFTNSSDMYSLLVLISSALRFSMRGHVPSSSVILV